MYYDKIEDAKCIRLVVKKGEGHRCVKKALENSSWRKNMLHNKLAPLIPNPLSI
jgi:hypothetical protein